jgi:O-antigen ligase
MESGMMTINLERQKFFFKKAFIIITVIYTSIISTVPRLSTLVNFLLLLWAAVIFALAYVREEKPSIKINRLLLLIFLFFSVLTILINKNLSSNLKILSLTVMQFFLLYDYNNYSEKRRVYEELYELSNIYVFMTFILSSAAMAMYLLHINFLYKGIAFGMTHYNALAGLQIGPNTVGLTCFFSIALSMLARRIYGRWKYFYCFNIVVQFLVLLLSKSRGALAGLAVYLAVYFFSQLQSKRLRRITVLGSLGAVLAVSFLIMNPTGGNLLVKDKELGFFSGRLLLWKPAAKVVENNIMLGVGVNNVVDEVRKVATESLPGIEGGGMHNAYIQAAVSNGLIATGCIIIFFIYILVKLVRASLAERFAERDRRVIGAMLALIVSLYVVNLVEAHLLYVANFAATIYWVYIGYGINLANKSEGNKV